MTAPVKKVDVHAHILPGADDGARDIRQSRQMLREARRQGFRAVIATPHCQPWHRTAAQPQWIRSQCRELEAWARKTLHPEFCVYPGQEIFYTEDLLERLERSEVLPLGESRYVLIEFHPSAAYSTVYRAVRELSFGGYTPVLAHIERYGALRQEGRVAELYQAGGRMQMNYTSVSGHWYQADTRWCRRMLKERRIHFLGTDMHDMGGRKPDTEAACQWMEAHLPGDYIGSLCWRNAEKILHDERVE